MREELKAVIVIKEETTPEEARQELEILMQVQKSVDEQIDPEAEFISFN